MKQLKLRLTKSSAFNCYLDPQGRYIICASFVKNRILGNAPKQIDLWVIPSEKGNITLKGRVCYTLFTRFTQIKYDMEGVRGYLTIHCVPYWGLLGKPDRVNVYAKEVN
jgi:hypothetical protein